MKTVMGRLHEICLSSTNLAIGNPKFQYQGTITCNHWYIRLYQQPKMRGQTWFYNIYKPDILTIFNNNPSARLRTPKKKDQFCCLCRIVLKYNPSPCWIDPHPECVRSRPKFRVIPGNVSWRPCRSQPLRLKYPIDFPRKITEPIRIKLSCCSFAT